MFIHSLVRKSDYTVVFATDDYDEYRRCHGAVWYCASGCGNQASGFTG